VSRLIKLQSKAEEGGERESKIELLKGLGVVLMFETRGGRALERRYDCEEIEREREREREREQGKRER
jgi:hypothetical protein